MSNHRWLATLQLECALNPCTNRTDLVRNRHHGPLRVQKPFYPEANGACHLLLLHPPAGIAGGDALSVSLVVGEGARTLLTTPGAGKWYGGGGSASQSQSVLVGAGAFTEWLPQETIVFNQSAVRSQTCIDVAASAAFIGWEMLLLGRTAHGETFREGWLDNATQISLGGTLVLADQLSQMAGSRWFSSPLGMSGATVLGHIWLAPPPAWREECGDEVLALRVALSSYASSLAITTVDGLIIGRFLGSDIRFCKAAFAELRAYARQRWFGWPENSPRIWAT